MPTHIVPSLLPVLESSDPAALLDDRVLTGAGAPDELGFRAEISLVRERFR